MAFDLTEATGFALTLWMVACAMRERPSTWPLAMASSGLYAAVFARAGLYAEAALQIVFVVLAIWGWWQWRWQPAPLVVASSSGQAPCLPLHIARLSLRTARRSAWALALGWPALAFVLIAFTDSSVPWLDALPTVLSLIALVWQGRKLLENWLLWALVNTLSVGLFASKGLWLTAALYALLIALSLWGWLHWHARMVQTTPHDLSR